MTATVIANAPQSRADWLKARKQGIGASDIPAILGFSSFGSPLSVYADKTTDLIEEEGITELAQFGTFAEPWLMEKIASDYDAKEWRISGDLYRSDDVPFMMCTLDGQILPLEDPWIDCELKTRPFADEWKEAGVPKDVFAQVQGQMKVRGTDRVLVGVLFRAWAERFFIEVPRDDGFIDDIMMPACDQFWKAVIANDPGDLGVDGSARTKQALRKIYEYDEEEPQTLLVDTSDAEVQVDYDDLADELEAVRESIKALTGRKDEIANTIAAKIGKAPEGITPTGRYFRYKEVDRKGYSVKATTYRALTGPFGGQK